MKKGFKIVGTCQLKNIVVYAKRIHGYRFGGPVEAYDNIQTKNQDYVNFSGMKYDYEAKYGKKDFKWNVMYPKSKN
jgi:hypothetical protein